MGWWRGALSWLAVVGVTFGLVLLLKVGFLACGPVFGPWSIHTPSGHTAAVAMVMGGLTALATGRRGLAFAMAALAAAAIGYSRVALGLHSVPEVLLGAALGIAGAGLLPRVAGQPRGRRAAFLIVAAVVAMALNGVRLPAEAAIWRASQGALDFVPACRGASVGEVRGQQPEQATGASRPNAIAWFGVGRAADLESLPKYPSSKRL
ncbi:MAG: phosphatase PAP2 family protein [Acetobacteraceae bacterium]|nr:phosphatase PAP2 family protein [Acetobacteraceae bacterium]